MKIRPMIALLAAAAAALLGAWPMAAISQDSPQGPRPTEPFRKEHQRVQQQLRELEAAVGKLSSQPQAEQKRTMARVVRFFEQEIAPHAAWEERVLYPAVDRRAGEGPHPFTSTMRYEHRIVERWIGDLAQQSRRPQPDPRAFTRKADNLLGLLSAHFEEEEEVLLPILDRTMSPADYQREIGEAHPPG